MWYKTLREQQIGCCLGIVVLNSSASWTMGLLNKGKYFVLMDTAEPKLT